MPQIGKCPACPSGTRDRILINGRCAAHEGDNSPLPDRSPETPEKAQNKPRKPLPKPTKPINKVSPKQKKLNSEYGTAVALWKKENPVCNFPGCDKPTEDCHHSRGRGKYLMDKSTWIPLCRGHHLFIESHPQKAKELGLSGSRLNKNS